MTVILPNAWRGTERSSKCLRRYQSVDGQFVARWENARLQVCAATPAAAMTGLRRCAMICPHIGGDALPYPASARVVTPSPMSTNVATEYQLFIDCVKARRRFRSEPTVARRCQVAGPVT
ncbi:hypothetical protein [Paraburkholderia kirstenboschensis]|uniref:Uncharacterized protein n=1 Tax=Paraburkholderia kirstenboschensis TaxID=1245436 RepID=A0ABZ0EBI1_9BURK|nr:hypothetical protein [Paraburkholderia kirstenboschensis]WOD14578.1 hypothetical protein RW095_03885 [Paraburkholderia kirstenboschensis]